MEKKTNIKVSFSLEWIDYKTIDEWLKDIIREDEIESKTSFDIELASKKLGWNDIWKFSNN